MSQSRQKRTSQTGTSRSDSIARLGRVFAVGAAAVVALSLFSGCHSLRYAHFGYSSGHHHHRSHHGGHWGGHHRGHGGGHWGGHRGRRH